METLRFARTITCTDCWHSVKPFIVSREYAEDGSVVAIELLCPVEGCGHRWKEAAESLR